MILIKNIEIMIVPNDIIKIKKAEYAEQRYKPIEQINKELEILEEQVYGKKFTNVNGETLYIGMIKDVQDAIGLPFSVYNRMRDTIEIRDKVIKKIRETIKYANFRNRLKYLLTRKLT